MTMRVCSSFVSTSTKATSSSGEAASRGGTWLGLGLGVGLETLTLPLTRGGEQRWHLDAQPLSPVGCAEPVAKPLAPVGEALVRG